MTTSDHDKEPASFHALPREIRQKILIESFNDATSKDLELNTYINLISTLVADSYMETIGYAPHIMTWASTLRSIEPVIASDIGYVMDQALTEVELSFVEVRHETFTPGCTGLRWRNLVYPCPFIQEGAYVQPWLRWIQKYGERRPASGEQRRVNVRMIATAVGIGSNLQLVRIHDSDSE